MSIPRRKPKLDDPEVKEAKRRFEKHAWQRKLTLTFEELFYLFEKDCSYTEIAALGGVRHQTVRRAYYVYFVNFLPR